MLYGSGLGWKWFIREPTHQDMGLQLLKFELEFEELGKVVFGSGIHKV